MSWVNKCKLPAIESIKYDNQQYLEIKDLWNAFHSIFNKTLYCHVNVKVLDKIDDKPILPWPSFSKEKFRLTLSKYNNLSAPGPDKLL